MLLIAWPVTTWLTNSHTNSITSWVQARGETVREIDCRYVNIGPYYYMKNARVYRVETEKNVYWFRFGLWTPSVYLETSLDEYKELNYD